MIVYPVSRRSSEEFCHMLFYFRLYIFMIIELWDKSAKNIFLIISGGKCGRHEIYRDSLNPCPLTCANPNPRPCPYMPINKGGCECAPGFVRNEANGECVPPNSCPDRSKSYGGWSPLQTKFPTKKSTLARCYSQIYFLHLWQSLQV